MFQLSRDQTPPTWKPTHSSHTRALHRGYNGTIVFNGILAYKQSSFLEGFGSQKHTLCIQIDFPMAHCRFTFLKVFPGQICSSGRIHFIWLLEGCCDISMYCFQICGSLRYASSSVIPIIGFVLHSSFGLVLTLLCHVFNDGRCSI